MKRLWLLLLAVALAAGCAGRGNTPAFHAIPTEATAERGSAAAFDHALDHPESGYYPLNDYFNMESGGSLHILTGFETLQQTKSYTCGAAAAQMVLHWFGEDGYDERSLAAVLGSNDTHGTTVEAVRDFFEDLGWNVIANAGTQPYFADAETFVSYAVRRLDEGTPLLVDWEDWDGHWQVIVGIDTMDPLSVYDDVLIFADPCDVSDHWQDGYSTFSAARFFHMWREGPCSENDPPYVQSFVIAHPSGG